MARRIWRNLLGVVLLAVGIVGIVLPATPALILIPAGLLLIDWPGRRWLQRRLRRLALFRRGEAWLMHKWGIRLDQSDSGGSEAEQTQDHESPGKPNTPSG